MTISQGYLGSWESANVWVKGACPYHMYRLDLGLWRADTEVNDKSSVASCDIEREFMSQTQRKLIRKQNLGEIISIRSGSERRNLLTFCFDVGVKTTKWPSSWWCEEEGVAYPGIVEGWSTFDSFKKAKLSSKLRQPWFLSFLSCFFAFWRFSFRVEKFETLPQCVLKKSLDQALETYLEYI